MGVFAPVLLTGFGAEHWIVCITAGSPAQNKKLFSMIASGGFDFDQLIDERHYTWIHVSYSEWNRRQVLHL